MRHRRWTILATLAIGTALLTGLVGCSAKSPSGTAGGGQEASASAPVTIVEENYEFNPAEVTVKVGDTLTFENKDDVAHRVSVNGQDLGQQSKGHKVTWTATAPGTLTFTCTIHPEMTGQVTVK